MLLLAEGLFRLDVVISGDTLRLVVRNLSTGELTMESPGAGYAGVSIGFGEIEPYEPTKTTLEFALGAGADRVAVSTVLGTLRFAERGTVRITAQAIVRKAPQTG
jgi:hypothetical protein